MYKLGDSDDELDMYNYISGASFIHFPNAKIGDGGFIRVDAGVAFYRAKVISKNEEIYIGSDIGIGVLAGGGWAYPIREGTRLMAGLNFANAAGREGLFHKPRGEHRGVVLKDGGA